MSTIKYYGDYGSDGTVFGRATSDYIGFYGVTPVSQRSGATQASITVSTITTAAITTTTNAYGFATTTQANDLTATVAAQTVLLNEMWTVMKNLGLMKGSA